MTDSPVEIRESYDAQVVTITLNAPPANILNSEMMESLAEALRRQSTVPQRKLVILTGAGAHFCYGASVEEHLPDRVTKMLPSFHQFIGSLVDLPIPSLARVSGQCLGGGFELALACSFLFADETARFAVPEIQLGVFPPVAAAILPSQLPQALFNSLIVLAEKVAAHDLAQWGLVNRVVRSSEWEKELRLFIEEKILPRSASSLQMAHRASRMNFAAHYHKRIDALEKLYLGELMSTHDATEGLKAFLEKRRPIWSNT